MKITPDSYRFPSLFLIVGVAMAGVVPAVRVFSKEKRHVPQRVAPVVPGVESNVAVELVIEPDGTPEPRTLIAPGFSVPDEPTPPAPAAQPGETDVVHVGRVISGTPVPSKGVNSPASRAGGSTPIGDPCSCDQDCDAVGDQCNIVQCIVRSFCTDNTTVPCTTDQDCAALDAGTCTDEVANCDENDPPDCNFVQRCAMVQLIDWPCVGDADFCTLDRCEDDGSGTGHSTCIAQEDGTGGTLSVCAKQCVGGPAVGLRCNSASDCPQGSCQITAGGGCDSAAEACYVGASLATAIGRCCDAGACTETDGASCAGAWYRYRDPEEQEGDDNCLCPKYGSGVAPPGDDLGSIGLVRPSGLTCVVGSRQTGGVVYCEDIDGDGLSPNFCQKRCVGGDNEGGVCQNDNPDCSQLGLCSIGGTICTVANEGADCGICSISGEGCDGTAIQPCPDQNDVCEFDVSQTCPPTNPGTCIDDICVPNDIEGGCEDGFLNIGDDYFVENGSFLRLTQFRFRGGITNLGEDFVIEFWDESGTKLVDAFAVNNLDRTGTHDWTIEVDCWPNCNPFQLEVPEQRPIIIPPNGYVVMRSRRTVGTINGAAAFWSQTDHPADIGLNDNTKAWVDGDPNGSLGTNVFIFELVGYKELDPLGACCVDAESCEDTLRWDCGFCTETETQIQCASTLHDCPAGGLGGSFCQFNRWFGPISHDEIEFGGQDLTLCNGLGPCDTGACCQGSSCTVGTEEDCINAGGDYRGVATDCVPNCCPVDDPTGSDCICSTSICVDDQGNRTGFLCQNEFDCDQSVGPQTCVLQCEPRGTTQLRHPYECHDDIGSPLEPPIACDPEIGDADCPPIPCSGNQDCPNFEECNGGFCDFTFAMTCEQSFTGSFVVARNDTISDVADLFIASDGDACSLDIAADGVGWYELINLPDPTPGLCSFDGTTECRLHKDCSEIGLGTCQGADRSDDCFILTVGLCCTDPLLTPIWPFLSSFKNCPCADAADVIVTAPDIDLSGDQLDGFGADSKASLAGRCEDGNYSATFTVPPGEYAYQISADTSCAGSAIPCDTDDDCPGSSCVRPNPDYSVIFTVESCQVAACCVGDECILTNELDCLERVGNFLGGGDQPIVTCHPGTCDFGSCCVDGECNDEELNTLGACEAQEGIYVGALTCFDDPCPACPFNKPANCQQVQTVFGAVPLMDRNPENGSSDGTFGTVLADDVQFGGSQVDEVCWNTGFFQTPCCQNGCAQNVDTTWEIRIYETDPDCAGLPGLEVGLSTITVLNKVEGTGQATATWHYSGSMDNPITLPNGGLAGDTYWFEVSAFGGPGCEVRATWSRDHGNAHYVSTQIALENDPRVYDLDGIGGVDVGFCENSGIATPNDVLGACCTCPGFCQENLSRRDCDASRGVWVPCADCSDPSNTCSEIPENDDCSSPFLISNVPESLDGLDFLTITDQKNICATDDGPGLSADPLAGCSASLDGGADLHNDLWYSYNAEACGDLTIKSCGAANFDQMIAVYDAPNGCPLTTKDELTCDDDTCGIASGSATVTLRVEQGQKLLVRVGGWNNEVPGGFDGDPRGVFTLEWSLTIGVCPNVFPPIPAPPPHDILKNRYISIDPRGAKGTNPSSHHISVTKVSTQVNGVTDLGATWWATAPVNGQPPSPASCISVLSQKPASEPDWSGCPVVHLTGCPIIPTTTYALAVEAGGELSAEALFDTQAMPDNDWWGDTVGSFNGADWTPPNGTVNIDDAVAGVKTWQNPNAFNAVHLSVGEMAPGNTNLVVNFNDVFQVVRGFRGNEYPFGSADSGGTCSDDVVPGGNQEIRFLPIRSAPLGSPVGTVGDPVNAMFNGALGCWEVVVAPGVEVDLDLQASGWDSAVGSPTLGAIQATVLPAGYANGVGGNLIPKGWPGQPGSGAYQAKSTCQIGGDGSPCSEPFDPACGGAGFCISNPNWIMPNCAGDLAGRSLSTLDYGWAAAAVTDCVTDDGLFKTMGGLILEVPANAMGTYVIALDPDPNNSFMTTGAGLPISGTMLTSACITIGGPCCLPGGSCMTLSPEECAMSGGMQVCTCRGDVDPANGVDDACEADCDGDEISDIVEIADCPPGNAFCSDCNSNCIPDECDTAVNDCNSNGIPDECESGCNSNGIPDECDIDPTDPDGNGQVSEDCNNNGIPDECETDCNDNGVPDDCDIDPSDPDGNGQVSPDSNANGVPDECDPGACCFILALNGNFSCLEDTEENCAVLTEGLGFFQGIDTKCPTEGVGTNIHLGVVVTHVTDPAQLCGPPDGGRAECIPGDPIDPWQTAVDADICHQFGVGPVSPPIPADFFGPGSDPFTGQVCLEGTPLGLTPEGEFGDADTLVRRTGGPAGTGDPFDRCELPSANEVTVNAEVVALSLQSIAPIIVTFNGGQNPESWDAVVGLSAVTPPPGTITAVKTHCNGGTYNSELHVQPKFTFTKVDDPNNSAVLDTGLAGIPFVALTQDTDPQWTSDVSETLGLPSAICTDFHPGIEDTAPRVDCDCNANEVRDLCEIESPSLAPSPHDILKNRYISIDPRGASGANVCENLDIRLTLSSTLVNGVTEIGSQWWANSPDANCIAVVGPARPPTPPNWDACPTLHLTGCPIIPTSTYDIVVVAGAIVSDPPLVQNTQAKPGVKWHGDCVGFFTGTQWTAPNGQTSIDDAVAAIKTFQNPDRLPGCATPPCNATHTSVTDVVPNLTPGPQINKIVNIADVFSIIQGFQGLEYPGPDLAQCP